MIKIVKGEEELTDDDIHPEEDQTIIDPETGAPVDFDKKEPAKYTTEPEIIMAGPIISGPRPKVYVAGVDVSVLNERVQHLGGNGKLITESLKDYTKKGILQEYRSLDDFLARWNGTHKKKAIISELESHGVILDNLLDEVKKDLDIFDLICHIAWDMLALTRRERAEQVRKRNYFTKYGDKVRMVIEALLDKYADEGIENIEDLAVLRVEPFNQIGTPAEIIQIFGGRDKYLHVIEELEHELYAAA
jgi:type I restriction enzyme R subunit